MKKIKIENKNYINSFFSKLYSLIQKSSILKKIKNIMYFIDKILVILISKPMYIKKSRKKLLIMYNLALGDSIVFLNSLESIRKLYSSKEYELTLICQKGLEKLFSSYNIFDNVFGLDFIKSTFNLKERFNNIKFLRKEYYDLVLDPVGANSCLTNVLMTNIICAKRKIGCVIQNMEKTCPNYILTKTYNIIKELNETSLISQYYEFFYNSYKVNYIKSPSNRINFKLPDKYFIIFPSASTYLKCWPIERYADIAKKVYNKTKIPLLLCGTLNDIDKVNKLIELLEGQVPYINIVDKTSLLEFVEVIKRAKLVVTNDTSTYHIAVINQVPVAIITGGYTFDRYVKYDFMGKEKYRQPCYIVHQMKCFNCDNRCKYINKNSKIWPCLDKVSVTNAWKKIEDLIIKENIGGKK